MRSQFLTQKHGLQIEVIFIPAGIKWQFVVTDRNNWKNKCGSVYKWLQKEYDTKKVILKTELNSFTKTHLSLNLGSKL